MKKMLLILIMIVCGGAAAAEAQDRPLAPAHAQFRQSIEEEAGERRLKEFKTLFPQFTTINTQKELADYVRALDVHACPLPDEGSACLYDSSAKLWIASLSEQKFVAYPSAGPPASQPVATIGIGAATSQGPVNHWSTLEGCLAVKNASVYVPEKERACPLRGNEIIVDYPAGACAEMDLPVGLGGRGWVRVTSVIANGQTREPIRYEPCCNDIHKLVPLPVSAPASTTPAAQPTPIADAVKDVRVSGEILHRVEGQVRTVEPNRGPSFFSHFKKKKVWIPTVAGAILAGYAVSQMGGDETHIKITIR